MIPLGDLPAADVKGGEFHFDLVPREHSDIELFHGGADVSLNGVAPLKINEIEVVGQSLLDDALAHSFSGGSVKGFCGH